MAPQIFAQGEEQQEELLTKIHPERITNRPFLRFTVLMAAERHPCKPSLSCWRRPPFFILPGP
jgi:hypothetical protein